MFLSELTPLAQKLLQQPIAFAGGFCSGLFKLELNQEPLSDWLNQQGYNSGGNAGKTTGNNNDSGKPQSISID